MLLTVSEVVVKYNIEPQYVETLILSDQVESFSGPTGKTIDEDELKKYLFSSAGSKAPELVAESAIPDESFTPKSLLAPCKQTLQTNINRTITLFETAMAVYQKAAEISDNQDKSTYTQAANEARVCIELCQEFKEIIATADLRKELVVSLPNSSSVIGKADKKDNMPLSELGLPLSKYILHILRRNGIVTQGDILRFIGTQGFEGLKAMRGLSAQSYQQLEKALYEMDL